MSDWENYQGFSGKGHLVPGWKASLYRRHLVGWLWGQWPAGRVPPAPAGRTCRTQCACGCRNYKTEAEGYGAIRALDPRPGRRSGTSRWSTITESGVLSTAGGLVFGGGMDGDFIALDAKTGKPLWHVYLGGANASGPISYAVNGKQYIVGTGDGTMYAFALPD